MDIMSPAEIMDTVFEVLRKNIKTILLYGIGFSLIAFILSILLVVLTTFLSSRLVVGGASVFSMFIMIVFGILSFSLIGSLYFAFGIGFIKISAKDILNYQVQAGQLIKNSITSVFKVFKILISIFIISIPITVVVGVIVYLIFPLLEQLSYFLESSSGGQGILGFIFFLVLGLLAGLALMAYFTVFCFTLQAAFIERRGPVNSIKRSFELVKANFKEIYGFFILFTFTPGAINISLQGLITLCAGIVFVIMKLINMEVNYVSFISSVYNYTRLPLNIISWLIISPLIYVMLTILYFNQRCKLEGYDIILKLEELKYSSEGE